MMTARRIAPLATVLGLLAALAAAPAAAQPAAEGQWHSRFELAIQPIFTTLLKDGRVLCLESTFSYGNNSNNDTILLNLNHAAYPDNVTVENWDDLEMTNIPHPQGASKYNWSCSSFAQLPSGKVVFIGGQSDPGVSGVCDCYDPPPIRCVDGHNLVAIFDPGAAVAPSGKPWNTNVDKMTFEGLPLDRWYPVGITLGDGTILATGGRNGDWQTRNADMPAVFDPAKCAGAQWDVKELALWPGSNPDDFLTNMAIYPRMTLRANGELFYSGATRRIDNTNTWRLNLGTEQWTKLPDVDFGQPGHAKYRGTTGVTYYRRTTGGSWEQSFLKAGGRADDGETTFPEYFGDRVEHIVLTGFAPVWQELAPMDTPRGNFYVVPLPDGRILAVGGNVPEVPPNDPNYDHFDRANFPDVLAAELYDPDDNSWTSMASLDASAPRRHHSVALLLPDARVLAAGGQYWLNGGPDFVRMKSGQIYSPPYLFNSDGTAATRPVIDSAPATILYNQGFDISTTDAASVSKVSLVRLGALTHSFDHGARYLPLEFTSTLVPENLRIVAPPNSNIAPPGYYMLYILKPGNNPPYEVPSEAKMVKLAAAF